VNGNLIIYKIMKTITKPKSIIFDIDTTLEFGTPQTIEPEKFNKNISQVAKANDWGAQLDESITKTTVRDCIAGNFRHKNYLSYLQMCWDSHYGVSLKPDNIWHLILNEIAELVNKDPETYRDLFTNSNNKKEIIVTTGDPQLIPLESLISELKNLVPMDIETFLPTFSTTTLASRMAFNAAFCEAASPFYNYSMMLCGISRVKIYGNKGDWNKIVTNVEKISKIFTDKNAELKSYFNRVVSVVESIVNNLSEDGDSSFWKNIFELERCGSGGQKNVKGWFKDLYINNKPTYVGNYSTTVSNVPYKLIGSEQIFELCYGLFSSNIEGDYLEPEFGYIINEIKKI